MMLKLKLQYFGHLMWRVDSLEGLWCWEGLGAGGEGDDRGWDGWMASLTWWTWVWVNSRSWCWTGRPGVLRFMGLQRVGHGWATELNWLMAIHLVLDWLHWLWGPLTKHDRYSLYMDFFIPSFCISFPLFLNSRVYQNIQEQTSPYDKFYFGLVFTVPRLRSYPGWMLHHTLWI